MSKIITRFLLIRDGDEVKRQIEEQYGSVNKFCEERGVIRRTLNKALAGEGIMFGPATKIALGIGAFETFDEFESDQYYE